MNDLVPPTNGWGKDGDDREPVTDTISRHITEASEMILFTS